VSCKGQGREQKRREQKRGEQKRGEQKRGEQKRGEQKRGEQKRGEQKRGKQKMEEGRKVKWQLAFRLQTWQPLVTVLWEAEDTGVPVSV
jgi:hypothetical protein